MVLRGSEGGMHSALPIKAKGAQDFLLRNQHKNRGRATRLNKGGIRLMTHRFSPTWVAEQRFFHRGAGAERPLAMALTGPAFWS
jgi:hypothetical protein